MPIGSLTKGFTAAAIGELVAEGRVDWNVTPVSKYLPEFELQDPVLTSQLTIQDLLSHRTTLPMIDLAWYWSKESRIELIKRLKHVKVQSKLTPYANYNNVTFAVAAEAVAKVEGIPFEDIVKEKVIKRLGLNSTGFSSEELGERPNHALPYEANSFEDAQNGVFNKLPLENVLASFAPAGDMYSNVLDLVRYGDVIMRYGEYNRVQVLNKDSITEILSSQSIFFKERRSPDVGATATFGMGWVPDSYKGKIMYHHGGHAFGFISHLAMFPDQELVVAHISNIHTSSLKENLVYLIADEILGLPKTQDWTQQSVDETKDAFDHIAKKIQGNIPEQIKDKSSSNPLNEFEGVYSNPVYGDLVIRLEIHDDGKEEIHFKYSKIERKLEHYHYDSFLLRFKYSALSITELVSFVTDPSGKVSGLRIKFYGQMQEFSKKQ
ncbi:hypothetical protein BGZ76_002679 [Entomortierella beljakovae]|nr:hypothetical protein BGZ76_002679 [Entomortierella beljakovae]